MTDVLISDHSVCQSDVLSFSFLLIRCCIGLHFPWTAEDHFKRSGDRRREQLERIVAGYIILLGCCLIFMFKQLHLDHSNHMYLVHRMMHNDVEPYHPNIALIGDLSVTALKPQTPDC